MLVGPSGCGKTTALRMVAGLEPVTGGEIRINDRVVTRLPPRDRDIAMVFQNYALYAHMSVRNNMALRPQDGARAPKDEIRRRVDEAAAMLGLTELLDRKPRQLSGGQRQRVAMGRAIVREPAAFLMDEPLSNLDAKLRVEMRGEIIRVQRRIARAHAVRDPRPDRGDDDGRPRRHPPRRRAAAAGHARRDLRHTRSTCSWPGSSGRRR